MASFLQASLILLLLTTTSCGGRSTEAGPGPDQSALVEVQNQGFSDVVVYAISGGQRLRLGLATGHSTKTPTVPRHLVGGAGPIRFLADPIGGNRTPVSEELIVQPGRRHPDYTSSVRDITMKEKTMTSDDSLPEAAMGGASDAGAHGMHPASGAKIEGRSARPEEAAGDAVVERRHRRDPHYNGPERRLGRSGG